jgi:hypothetical protein
MAMALIQAMGIEHPISSDKEVAKKQHNIGLPSIII